MGTIDASIYVALITLLGVVISNIFTYRKSKSDREAGIADTRKAEEERWGRLMDRLDSFENDLKEHGKKLDKHNGFEGRIIALEVIAEWMQKENSKNQGEHS